MASKLKALDHNWASDEKFAQPLRDDLIKIWRKEKTDRGEREHRWQEYYRSWSTDENQEDANYDGIANINLPQIRKEVETMSRRLVKGLFPADYLRAHTNIIANEDLAQVNTEIVRHYLDNVMKFKNAAIPWIKQGVIYGTSPIRTFWDRTANEQLIRKRVFKKKDGVFVPTRQVVKEEVVLYDAPVGRAEDLFQTWVYPSNASRVEDIEMVFWRTKITKSQLEAKAKKNAAFGIDSFKDDGATVSQAFDQSQERMAQFGASAELISKETEGLFTLLEIWLLNKLPDTGEQQVPVVVEIIDETHVIRVQRNGFWHQTFPFDFMRYIIPPPGEFYGRGLPEATIKVQQQLNDTLNQGMDSATLALNNITIINPAFAPNADSFEVEPRAVWWADPQGVKQMTFPDLSDAALKTTSLLRGIITEMSDNSPQLPDALSGKARSTGQAQLALAEFQTDILFFLDQIANESLKPFVGKVHSLLQQFIDDDAVIRITPKYARSWIHNIVEPTEIIGGFDFEWLASIDMDAESIKTQQMLNFIRVATQLQQVMPPEERVTVNWENYFIKMLRDQFKIRDFHNIIESSRFDDRIDPDMEYKILNLGGQIKVNVNDDHPVHIGKHTVDIARLKDPYQRSLMEKHIVEHRQKEQAKQVAIQQQALLFASEQQQKQPGQSGNPQQIPESTSAADLSRGQR